MLTTKSRKMQLEVQAAELVLGHVAARVGGVSPIRSGLGFRV